MTKEEYEKLLKSDYWKGYSYSLIKERNFTCHDCGRYFPGERHKLQVHHLHYRDASPWSYDPSELVVLCEECHKKRHGILPPDPPEPKEPEYIQQVETGSYNRSYEASYNTTESHVHKVKKPRHSQFKMVFRHKTYRNKRPVFIGLLLMFVIMALIPKQQKNTERVVAPIVVEPPVKQEKAALPVKSKSATPKSSAVPTQREPMEELERINDLVPEILQTQESQLHISEPAAESKTNTVPEQNNKKTTLELLEERNHAQAVERAKRAGVSTEGTTIEILERINHAQAVESAKRAGVSTEGTTIEILERINRKQLGNN